MTIKSLSGLSLEEITTFITELGLPKFRAKQIHSWIYAKWAGSIDEMTDLSQELRNKLNAVAQVPLLKIAHLEVSRDGTRKYLFELPDGQLIESVLIAFDDRPSLTACLSSQVGCAVGCTFCATGYLGFKRNLTSQEIVDQILAIQRESGQRVGNIVYMGQGEPLLNCKEVIKSLHLVMESVGIGARHITVSTSGIVPGIDALARENLPITLALSLHAPDTETREEIVPITTKYPIHQVMEALHNYVDTTRRRVTIEYVLLEGVNDSEAQARQLAELCRDLHCNINLIPFNPTMNKEGVVLYGRPEIKTQQRFRDISGRSGKTVTIRLERGTDIDAACGQLANKFIAAQA
ncbi:MAG: rRNA (adenine2503-C2)-methyltransferase [Cyanobacteriota bacterium erpe_2018_sw_39hr_WHONDRS-SW48-000098_B_bin.30]|nr:23S rRNA (adenine(2503)-C(2))-methyltransferase RlmN [Candidatus Obscuribacter sp.]MDQ5966066.1 rRNA (adenine2503-C2)-methyltransferase [Cyanobacteriota bacterium erpe_2018_sw_39hr_WHONDRS-SW48-000098_B_bin.30]